jgi:hypothetical protein
MYAISESKKLFNSFLVIIQIDFIMLRLNAAPPQPFSPKAREEDGYCNIFILYL